LKHHNRYQTSWIGQVKPKLAPSRGASSIPQNYLGNP
jgi:hypothetical protein